MSPRNSGNVLLQPARYERRPAERPDGKQSTAAADETCVSVRRDGEREKELCLRPTMSLDSFIGKWVESGKEGFEQLAQTIGE